MTVLPVDEVCVNDVLDEVPVEKIEHVEVDVDEQQQSIMQNSIKSSEKHKQEKKAVFVKDYALTKTAEFQMEVDDTPLSLPVGALYE